MTRILMLIALLSLCAAPAAAQEGGPYYRPSVVVQIAVADLDKSIDFYERVLGFKMTERRDDLKFAHVQTNVPGLELGLTASGTVKGTGAVVINIEVVDVAATRKLLESRGVVFVGPTQIIPGKVALAGFRDPDGNRLSLAGVPPPKPAP